MLLFYLFIWAMFGFFVGALQLFFATNERFSQPRALAAGALGGIAGGLMFWAADWLPWIVDGFNVTALIGAGLIAEVAVLLVSLGGGAERPV